MEKYAEKMRQRKLRGGKAKIAGEFSKEEVQQSVSAKWVVKMNAASTAIAQRWLRKAQDSLTQKFRAKGNQLRKDVDATVRAMPPEDDWYYGAALRQEGQDIKEKGEMLFQDQRTVEAEAAVKIRRIEHDFQLFEAEKQVEIDDKRRGFEADMAKNEDRLNAAVETRTRELQRSKDNKREEFDEIERKAREEKGAASTKMIEEHRRIMQEMDEVIRTTQQRMEDEFRQRESEQRGFFGQAEKLLQQVIIDRKVSAVANIRRIRKEAMSKIKQAESNWQSSASRWLYIAKRKVELKEREDAEAAAAKRRKKRR